MDHGVKGPAADLIVLPVVCREQVEAEEEGADERVVLGCCHDACEGLLGERVWVCNLCLEGGLAGFCRRVESCFCAGCCKCVWGGFVRKLFTSAIIKAGGQGGGHA